MVTAAVSVEEYADKWVVTVDHCVITLGCFASTQTLISLHLTSHPLTSPTVLTAQIGRYTSV